MNKNNLTPKKKNEITEKQSSPIQEIKQTGKDVLQVAVNDEQLMKALGSKDENFLYGLLEQIVNAGTRGRSFDGKGVEFMLSVVKGINPKDQVEAMLASQMAAVQMATMTFARRLAHVENIPQQDSAEHAFNKLARTFVAQMEALTRYRGKGQQKMTVEHVHVHQGGQAIVGNVNQEGGGVKNEK